MRNLKKSVLSVICCLAGFADAKIITVDNNAGSVAMHTSLQAAINSAATGDTILIAGSPNGYGNVDVGRRLNFVGPGYFLGENGVPGINKNRAEAGFALYRRDLLNATNCTFSGLRGGVSQQDAGITGILVDKCHLASASGSMTFSRCYLDGGVNLSGGSIRNSIIGNIINLADGTTVTNCVVRDFNSWQYINTTPGSSISNTIFITSTAVSFSKAEFAQQCKGSISHCLAVSGPGPSGGPSYLPTGLGNIPTIQLFYDVFTGGNMENAYSLISDSPAKGAGFDALDLGIFSGVRPYVISGLAQLPRITRFVVPAKATSSSGLRIEMDAEAF
jgi:hypothetical protein